MDAKATLKRIVKAVVPVSALNEVKKQLFLAYARSSLRGRAPLGEYPFGVNLIGPIRGDYGLGESCRLIADVLRESGVPFGIVNTSFGNGAETNEAWAAYERTELPYRINLIHVNPAVLAQVAWTGKQKELFGRCNIAYWLWELPEFPAEWDYAFAFFDEIWTPAEFISEAIRKRTDKPVRTVPYAFGTPQTESACKRAYFGLPEDKFLFMLSYDGNSVSERKNPWGALRAYRTAFSPDDTGVGLVVKATHASDAEIAQLRELLRGYPNLFILRESYPKPIFNSLIACVDCYVSLHRAEGFGLVMAEAMLLGTPTIATNYSANMEFMDDTVACMVPATVIELERDIYPYHKGNHWASPDEDAAAAQMRRLYEDRAFCAALAERARERMETQFSLSHGAEVLRVNLPQEVR